MIRFSRKEEGSENLKQFVAAADFWEKATVYFTNAVKGEKILLRDDSGKILASCYEDDDIFNEADMWYFDSIYKLRGVYSGSFSRAFPEVKQVCIIGLNEMAWRIYHLLQVEDVLCSVIGEEWEWFGIKTIEWNQRPLEECGFIYAEGQEFIPSYKTATLRSSFAGLRNRWIGEIKKCVWQEELNRLESLGCSVCRVKIPQWDDIKMESCTKNELINKLLIPKDPRSEKTEDLNEISRQIDFYGEELYKKLVAGENFNQDAWKRVLFRDVRAEKCKESSYKNKIYLIGPCIVADSYAAPKETITATLQRWVEKFEYEIIRIAIPNYRMDLLREELQTLPLRKKDIVVCIDSRGFFDESDFGLDLTEVFNRPRKETWIRDGVPLHVNARGDKAIAKEIFVKYLKEKCKELRGTHNNLWIQKGELVGKTAKEALSCFVESIREERANVAKKVGGIVMNCNPFTSGHQFLIETAAREVDFLYVFVVEEDESFFPFVMRIEMVKRGIAHLNNVAVVPSGNYILSFDTLPIYFEKAEKQTAKIDASNDIGIFAQYIAPSLGITCRFVGEEPTDLITRQYNEQMANLLPEYGIELIEIPRKMTREKQIISASQVRCLLKDKNWDAIKAFVPETTVSFLMKLVSYKLVIYGAGKWGKKVYDCLTQMGCDIVGWFDKKYIEFDESMGIEAPDKIKSKRYDYIVVSVESEILFSEIKKTLCETFDVEERRIIGPIAELSNVVKKIKRKD